VLNVKTFLENIMNGIDLLLNDDVKLKRLMDDINGMSDLEAQGIMAAMDWEDKWLEDVL